MNEDTNPSATTDPVVPEAPATAPDAPVAPDAAPAVPDAPVAPDAPAVAPEGAVVPEESVAPATDAAVEPKEGDVCEIEGKAGHLTAFGDGSLQCTPDPVVGEHCTCPDGRDGVYGTLDDTGTLYCVPTVG